MLSRDSVALRGKKSKDGRPIRPPLFAWQGTEQSLDEGEETGADLGSFIQRKLLFEFIAEDVAEICEGFVAEAHAIS